MNDDPAAKRSTAAVIDVDQLPSESPQLTDEALRRQSLAVVRRISQENDATPLDDDDDDDDDDDWEEKLHAGSILYARQRSDAELTPFAAAAADRYEPLRRLFRRRCCWVVLIPSIALAAVLAWLLAPTATFQGIALWKCISLPAFYWVVYSTMHVIEWGVQVAIGALLDRATWTIRVFAQALLAHVHYVLVLASLTFLVLPYWLDLGAPDASSPGGRALIRLVDLVLIGVSIMSLFAFGREMFLQAIRYRITRRSYKHALDEVLLIDDALQLVCASGRAHRDWLQDRWQHDPLRRHFMDRIDRFTQRSMTFPLATRRRPGPDSRRHWAFSTTDVVEVQSDREMAAIAYVIHHSFLTVNGKTTLALADLADCTKCDKRAQAALFKLFQATKVGRDNSHLLVDRDHDAIDEDQFAMILTKHYQSRTILVQRIAKFMKIAKLLQSVFDLPCLLAATIAIANLNGISFADMALSVSAVVLSASFAFGQSIQQFVRSLLFLFVANPFEVDDLVQVDGGDVERVHNMSIMQTEFITASGQHVCRPNATLLAAPIVNLSRSHKASLRITIDDVDLGVPDLALDKLRRAVVRYASKRRYAWKPVVHVRIGDRVERGRAMQLDLHVRSMVDWRRIDLFRDESYLLKNYVRHKIVKYGIGSAVKE